MLNSRQPDAQLDGRATVSSDWLRLIAVAAEARGLDVTPIFAASGLDMTVLSNRGARVCAAAAQEASRRTVGRLSDPLFGLTLGEAIPLGALSRTDYLVISSADVGEAIGRVVRYAPLISDGERLILTVEGHEARFRCVSEHGLPHITEMVIGLFVRRARDLFGPSWAVQSISFAHKPQGPRAVYDRICQAPIQFEMPFNEVVFARDMLTVPMVGADARMSAIFLDEADAALATVRPPRASSFMDTVKRVLENGLDARDLTLTRLADHLGVSARTLQRRLRAAGVTHRGLVRGVREDLANRSLATRASQGQIARTLGYSGPGAFQRAFKRWSGMTPGQHRAR